MKLLFNKFIFFIFCIFFSHTIIAKEVASEYVIEVGKIDIGKVVWSITLDETEYKILIELEEQGFLSGLYSFSGSYSTIGKVINENLVPLNYKQKWVTKKKKSEVGLYFTNGIISKLNLFPKEVKTPKIKFLGTKNVFDPLSSFLNILKNNNSSKTVDGRRFYTMVVEKKNLQNNIVVKNIKIEDYLNIWAEHNNNDLNSIQFEHIDWGDGLVLPHKIMIKYKGIVFNLNKI